MRFRVHELQLGEIMISTRKLVLATSAVFGATLGLHVTAHANEPPRVEYRDGTSASDGPVTDTTPLIPMKFIEEKDHFKVISNNGVSPSNLGYKAAQFTLDNEKLEILATPSSVVVSSQPWHPERDKADKDKPFVARLMECDGPSFGGYGCRVFTGRENFVTLKARNFLGRDKWSIDIDPSDWIKAKGIELGNSARLTIEGEGISILKNFDLKPGFFTAQRPKIELTDAESDRVLGALNQGKSIAVQLQTYKGEVHSYEISSRDARMGFFIFQRIWPELKAAAECQAKPVPGC